MAQKTDITLYSLEGSRSVRTAWLLEELGIEYNIVSSPRDSNFLAPKEFKEKVGTFMGKFPTLVDRGVTVQESPAIAEYLCEYYDTNHHLLPAERAARAKVREFMAASEATILMHALPLQYARWNMEDTVECEKFVDKMTPAVQKDLDWLEYELAENQKKTGNPKLFLVGDGITAADTMVLVSIFTVFGRELGSKGQVGTGRWKLLEQWKSEMEQREAYKRAVDKTNFLMKK